MLCCFHDGRLAYFLTSVALVLEANIMEESISLVDSSFGHPTPVPAVNLIYMMMGKSDDQLLQNLPSKEQLRLSLTEEPTGTLLSQSDSNGYSAWLVFLGGLFHQFHLKDLCIVFHPF